MLSSVSSSRLIIYLLLRILLSRYFAPSMFVSSSDVKTHSRYGVIVSLSRNASIIATPMPLSAPSVVPLAFSQPSSIYEVMGSLEKSWSTSSSLTQTMS